MAELIQGRVAPGIAYVAPADALTITPKHDGIHVITVALSAAQTLIRRINGVDILMNLGVALGIDQENSFEFAVAQVDPYIIRFGGNATIRELVIVERTSP